MDTALVGQTISHYRIIEKLGEGGMGVVYLAEDTHLARRIAIKFLSSLDRSYRARFLREARAVSALTHPNIAAVFDYGETPVGQPYIVMEFVKGRTLSDTLEGNPLTVAQAVQIISSIAEALGEAHHQGIVHRDIKPSNVVITDRGQVKVLDFGLVKHLDDHDGEANPNFPTLLTTHTRSDIVVGTPLYLSPEQAMGKPLDGRSDLFALGAVLYECITGQSAFSGSSVIEIGAQIIHVDPPTPSTINSRVPPELDRITLKALQKSVAARYQSAAEMVADLRAVLANLDSNGFLAARMSARVSPTGELPARALTTLGATLRRPRLSIVTFICTILGVAMASWAVVHWWKPAPYKPIPLALDMYNKGSDALRNGAYLQASRLLEQAVTNDDKFALAHARLAEAWTELDYSDKAQTEMLRVSSLVPDRSLLPRIDALYLNAVYATVGRDFLTAAQAYDEISHLKSADAEVYVDLGRAYEKNDDVSKALENYLKATNLDGQYATAYLRAGVLYSRRRDLASASSVFDKAEALFKALGNVEGVAEVLRQRGILFKGLEKFDQAQEQLQKALNTARAADNQPQQVLSLLELSNLAFTKGSFEQAKDFATQAIAVAQPLRLENLVTGGLIDLGNALMGHGDYVEAEGYFRQAMDFARLNKGKKREAIAAMNLGSLYIQLLRTDEALTLLKQAQSYFQAANYRKELLLCLSLVARANRRKGNYDTALQALGQELELAKQANDQPQIAWSYGEIGSVFTELERYPEALKQYDNSYGINNTLGNLVNMAYNQHNRGNVLWRLGRYGEAREALAQALKIASQPDSKSKQLEAEIQLSYSQIDLSERHFAEAKSSASQAMVMAGTQYQNVAIEAQSIIGLATVYLGAVREGKKNCQIAVDRAREAGDDALLSRTMLALAESCLESRDTETALKNAKEAQERFARAGQQESEWRAWLVLALANQIIGNALVAQEQFSRAAKILSQIQEVWQNDAASYFTRPDIQVLRKQLG